MRKRSSINDFDVGETYRPADCSYPRLRRLTILGSKDRASEITQIAKTGDHPTVTRQTSYASWLIFFFYCYSPLVQTTAKNSNAQKAPFQRRVLLPVLIVLLSYCSVMSVLLNSLFVDLKRFAVNKAAARRIYLSMNFFYTASCPVLFSFCFFSIGNLCSLRESEHRQIGIGRCCLSMHVLLEFRSRCPLELDLANVVSVCFAINNTIRPPISECFCSPKINIHKNHLFFTYCSFLVFFVVSSDMSFYIVCPHKK